MSAIDPSWAQIHALAKHRCYLVAQASDPRWTGVKTLQTRVFMPNGDRANRVRIAVPGTLLYLPQYPKDWETHPDVFRTLECVVFRTRNSVKKTTSIGALGAGTYVFLLQSSLMGELIDGSKGELDILAMLEKRA